MIKAEKLWNCIQENDFSLYYLTNKCGVSSSTIRTLRADGYVRTVTIDRICTVLQREPDDLFEIVEVPNDAISEIISSARKKRNCPF
jgi:DNA-binding Xre family transcriptional regulator